MMKEKRYSIISFIAAFVFCAALFSGCMEQTSQVAEEQLNSIYPSAEVGEQISLIYPATEVEEPVSNNVNQVEEVSILEIPLPEPLNSRDAEISGMDWYGDKLVLLPQYPSRFKQDGSSSLFYIEKADILSYIQNPTGEVLAVHAIPFDEQGIQKILKGFEGFEAIAFSEDYFYITVETKPGSNMKGYLFRGEVGDGLSSLALDVESYQAIEPQADFSNSSDEALIIFQDSIYTFYEANGQKQNPNPVAHVFDFNLKAIGLTSVPNVEYRVTDATRVDAEGYFWVMNYFYSGDKHLKPEIDPIAAMYGEGPSHLENETVERLLKLRVSEAGIVLIDQAPIQFVLLPGDEARNWEGLVKLDELGFLVATDKFPETILGFCEILR